MAVANDIPSLEPYLPRRFVAPGETLDSLDRIEHYYRVLLDRDLNAAPELLDWVRDRCELRMAMEDAAARIYIRMTCQTDDAERANAYTRHVETIRPAITEFAHRLDEKYLEARARISFEDDRLDVYDRTIRTRADLFRIENVALEKADELLAHEYQTICGAMTAEFQGAERTMPELAKFMLDPDRSVREAAWRASWERRLADRDRLEDVFGRMLELRQQRARNAGYDDFLAYGFPRKLRFDYTPEDCRTYHAAVERLIVPLLRDIYARRRAEMGLDSFRPWDVDNYGIGPDPKGRAPLAPFTTSEELLSKSHALFHRLDPELGKNFDVLSGRGLLDVAGRPGKAPGGYQAVLNEARLPFIFMNAVGTDRDMWTLIHEAGHSFHTFACIDQEPDTYRYPCSEFAEVASIGMEFLASEDLSPFYSEEDLPRARREFLEGKVIVLAWIAAVDAFQQWLYTNPGHTRAEREERWLDVQSRFEGGAIDWSGLDAEHRCFWQRQLHFFQVPLYYIEYGIAQIGAMQLWLQAREDPAKALAHYKRALALGDSRPLPELFAAAELTFDLSERTLAPLVDAIREELDRLG